MLLPILLEKVYIAHAIAPETKICTNYNSLDREPLTKIIHKSIRRHGCDCGSEPDNDIIGNTAIVFCHSKLLLQGRQMEWLGLWANNCQRMWRECHQDGFGMEGLCHFTRLM